jgi:hypothetical protein
MAHHQNAPCTADLVNRVERIAGILPEELGDDLPWERYLQDQMMCHKVTAQSPELHEKLLSECEIKNTLVVVVLLMTCLASLLFVLETQAASAWMLLTQNSDKLQMLIICTSTLRIGRDL